MRPAGGPGAHAAPWAADGALPRMSFGRALAAEFVRLRRSSLVALHVACGLAAGLACGAYFAVAPWDVRFGTDAFVQLVGAMMPLMVGIVCGLNIDAEREATGLAYLLGCPSRRVALLAKVAALWILGALALALAVGSFAGVLATTGHAAFSIGVYGRCIVGMVLGSLVLYVLSVALLLRFGRNVSIAVGAVGLMCSLFAVGGLAHGLMTGELTAVSSGVLGYVPFVWAERLGSLCIELGIATGDLMWPVIVQLEVTAAAAVLVGAAATAVALVWIGRFEDGQRDA